MSGFPDGWRVSDAESRWLDSLSPQRRHAVLDAANALRVSHLSAAESLDGLLESFVDKTDGSDRTTDFLTSVAFLTDSLRASANGDFATATELMETANRYQSAALSELD